MLRIDKSIMSTIFLCCKIDIDECASNPCLNNATCLDMVNSYACNCPFDWAGTHCEIGNNITICITHYRIFLLS